MRVHAVLELCCSYFGILLFGLLCACERQFKFESPIELQASSVSSIRALKDGVALGTQRGLSIYNQDGSERCVFNVGEVVGRPASDGQRVIFATTTYLVYSISTDCKEQWKAPLKDRVKSDPLLHQGRVLVSSYDGHVYAFDKEAGRIEWTFPTDLMSEPTVDKKDVVQTAEGSGSAWGTGGSQEVNGPDKHLKVGAFSYSSPILRDGIVYLGNLDHHLYALDFDSGRLLWRFKTEGPISSTPAFADDLLVFGSNDGSVYALDRKVGKKRWSFDTGAWVNSSAYIEGGFAYIGSHSNAIFALNLHDGSALWRAETEQNIISRPLGIGPYLLVAEGREPGAIRLLDKLTGARVWSFDSQTKFHADPFFAFERYWLAGFDGRLYRLKVSLPKSRPQ